ncbi:GD16666 [Drosophila simulans]|uniref:GD16666 n=1 Tax=Drosophila simulans TaxID=7240 RepID=B4R488_DROSI|nr:GD16666 [Drosophila simulans]
MSKSLFDLPLTIDPEHELRFVGPFTRPVVRIMTLRNNSALPLVFKIKTTAPKHYCVRPNIGKITPFRSTQVEICLQPFVYDQQEKNKHKFMVQSVLAPLDADLNDLNKLWKELEPEQLMDAKLKCVFEMPSAEALESKLKLSIEDKLKPSNLLDTSESLEALSGEINALRECNSELRRENLHLKDQITRYRSSPAVKQVNEPYAPVLAEKQIPVFYIAVAIAAAIVSLLLGKFFL